MTLSEKRIIINGASNAHAPLCARIRAQRSDSGQNYNIGRPSWLGFQLDICFNIGSKPRNDVGVAECHTLERRFFLPG